MNTFIYMQILRLQYTHLNALFSAESPEVVTVAMSISSTQIKASNNIFQ